MINFKKYIANAIRKVADKIESDECELTPSEGMQILSTICHEPLSKEQACLYLNVSSSTFGELIRKRNLPKGKKVAGYKELRWYKDELDNYLYFKDYGNKKSRQTKASSC